MTCLSTRLCSEALLNTAGPHEWLDRVEQSAGIQELEAYYRREGEEE